MHIYKYLHVYIYAYIYGFKWELTRIHHDHHQNQLQPFISVITYHNLCPQETCNLMRERKREYKISTKKMDNHA